MKDYKIKQFIYNKTQVHDDDLDKLDFSVNDDLDFTIQYVVNYLTSDIDELVFPAKSYAVAIIYADMIEKKFSEPFMQSLSDIDLFCGTDKFFKTYEQSKYIYDAILTKIGGQSGIDYSKKLVKKTVQYFYKEFDLV
ncbi:MAG: hypothetical protein ACK41T_00305 [Pseudobdellovibrio sp.]